jgi:hypothetical protein
LLSSNIKFFSKYGAVLTAFFMPFYAFAADSKTDLFNPLPVAQQLFCPTAYCDLQSMALLIIKDFLTLIPVASVLFIIIGGLQLVISSGNEEKIIKAKKTILWAILGLVFAFMAFSIVAIVQNLLSGGA